MAKPVNVGIKAAGGGVADAPHGKERKVLLIPLADILTGDNPREEYDHVAMQELMQSMRHQGLMQPVGVRVLPTTGRYKLLFGFRRFLAAQKLGWDTIDSVLVDVADEKDALIKTSTENVIRANVSLTEQGRAFATLLKKGLTASEIAVRMGCSKDFVQKALDSFYHIPKKFHDRISFGTRGSVERKGMIPATVALSVTDIRQSNKLSDSETEKLMEWASKENINAIKVRTAGQLIGEGIAPAEAMRQVELMKTITLTFSMKIATIQKLQKNLGAQIHDIIYSMLEQHEALELKPGRFKASRLDKLPSSYRGKKMLRRRR